jgi:hypothetical protein
MGNGALAPQRRIEEIKGMTRRKSFGLLAAAMLVFGTLGGPLAAQEAPLASPVPSPSLSDLQDIEQIQDLFNAQVGRPRLILLIAPT